MPIKTHGTTKSTDSTRAHDGSAGQRNKDTLSKAYPYALEFQSSPSDKYQTGADGTDEVDVPQTTEGLNEFYGKHVMSGIKDIPQSDFSSVSLDYEGAPNISNSSSQAVVGVDPDNTIAPSGLGPTVATLDIENSTNPARAGSGVVRPVAVASYPSDGTHGSSTSPSDTSPKIASGGIYGTFVASNSATSEDFDKTVTGEGADLGAVPGYSANSTSGGE